MIKAAGTPTPEVLWFKNEAPVQIQPGHIGIFNDGTELRISGLQNNDIGDYTCIARNGEGRIHHTTKLVKAGKMSFLFKKHTERGIHNVTYSINLKNETYIFAHRCGFLYLCTKENFFQIQYQHQIIFIISF